MGGGGEVTKFVCGYMTCDPQVSRLRAGRPAAAAQGQHPQRSRRSVAGKFDPLFGDQCRLRRCRRGGRARQALRGAVRRNPAPLCRRAAARAQTGWLAGAQDPEVGKALGLLHRQPARPLDHRRSRLRGGHVPRRACRALPPLPGRTAHRLSHPLAAAARRAPAHHHRVAASPRSPPRSATIPKPPSIVPSSALRRAARPLPQERPAASLRLRVFDRSVRFCASRSRVCVPEPGLRRYNDEQAPGGGRGRNGFNVCRPGSAVPLRGQPAGTISAGGGDSEIQLRRLPQPAFSRQRPCARQPRRCPGRRQSRLGREAGLALGEPADSGSGADRRSQDASRQTPPGRPAGRVARLGRG